MRDPVTDYDSPWKEALSLYFERQNSINTERREQLLARARALMSE